MRSLVTFAVMLLLVAGCATQEAREARPLDIIVVGSADDAGPQVYRRTSNGVKRALDDAGHDVYDETMLTLDDFELGGRLSESDWLDIARSVSPEMDVVVVLEVDAASRQRASSTQGRVSLSARAVQLGSGRSLGTAEDSARFRVDRGCSGACLQRRLGDEGRIIGSNVGAQLLGYLGGQSVSRPETELETAFEISLDGFKGWEAAEVEEALAAMKEYQDHRVEYSDSRRLELWYETTASASQINRQLRRIFDELGVRANIQYSGNAFTVNKITPRPQHDTQKTDEDWQW